MIPKASDLNISNWKFDGYNSYNLKIKGTNILIGGIYEDFTDKSKVCIYSRFSNTRGDFINVPLIGNTINPTDYHKEWESCMNKTLTKLFK